LKRVIGIEGVEKADRRAAGFVPVDRAVVIGVQRGEFRLAVAAVAGGGRGDDGRGCDSGGGQEG
jgi:hypothetical protein